MCAYQEVRNVRFLEYLGCFVFLKHPFWDSLFFPYYRRINALSSFSNNGVTLAILIWSGKIPSSMDRLKIYLIVSKGYNIIVHQLNKDLLHQGLNKHKKRNLMFKSKTKELLISGVSSQPALKLTQTTF